MLILVQGWNASNNGTPQLLDLFRGQGAILEQAYTQGSNVGCGSVVKDI